MIEVTRPQAEKLEIIALSYTYEQQREIFEEECAGAILAAQKLKRYADDPDLYLAAVENFASEVADVLIMAEQMKIFLGNRVEQEIDRKLDRQIGRIRAEE